MFYWVVAAMDLSTAGIISIIIYSILLLLGLVFAFFGERIISALAIVIGAIIGAALGFIIGSLVVLIFQLGGMAAMAVVLAAIILGLILGAISAKRMLHGFIAASLAALAFMISIGVANSFDLHMYATLGIAFLIAVVVFIIALMLAQKLLCILTAGMGAIMASYCTHTFLVGLAPISVMISNLIALVLLMGLAIAGSIFQLEARRKGKSRQPPRRSKAPPPGRAGRARPRGQGPPRRRYR